MKFPSNANSDSASSRVRCCNPIILNLVFLILKCFYSSYPYGSGEKINQLPLLHNTLQLKNSLCPCNFESQPSWWFLDFGLQIWVQHFKKMNHTFVSLFFFFLAVRFSWFFIFRPWKKQHSHKCTKFREKYFFHISLQYLSSFYCLSLQQSGPMSHHGARYLCI